MRRAQRRAAASPPASPADPLLKSDTGPLLLAQSQALTSRIAAINELAVAINSSPTLDGILPLVAEQAKWILDFEYCAIALLAPGDDTYRLETPDGRRLPRTWNVDNLKKYYF